jgi:ubiquinone/menaquinone biosynthesis C-methylase UbiE
MTHYFMENPEEALRLESKTDPEAIRSQARWCGLKPGCRVLDVGCGSGKTASILHDMVQPDGEVLGIDMSEDRIRYAREHFNPKPGLAFHVQDFTKPIADVGGFDFVWMQFVLEYFREEAGDIVKNMAALLKPEGYLCLLDLDYNCMTHYPMTEPMQAVIRNIAHKLEVENNFDPYVGRKLYAYLYDGHYRDIQSQVMPHGLVYGDLHAKDHFNWSVKMKIASQKAGHLFKGYPGGEKAFFDDFFAFFEDPRRFSYSPLIVARGKRPKAEGGGI